MKPKRAEGKKRYSVCGTAVVSVHTVVVASTPDEAKNVAVGRPMVTLCHQCSRGFPTEKWSMSNGIDGDIGDELEVIECDE